MAHEVREGDYAVSDDPSWIDEGVVHTFLRRSHWAADIPFETQREAMRHSLNFSIRRESAAGEREMVGFGRVVTDRATFAYLCDVFVLEEHRGRGLSTLLMNCIMTHPALQGLRRFVLSTKDAHGIYERYGFRGVRWPERYMEILDPEIYTKAIPPG